MADKRQTPNSWKQHRPMTAARSHLVTGSVATEQPQFQPQPRARPFNGAVQGSGSNTHQSHQLYKVSPHVQLHSQPQFQTQPQLQSYQTSGSSLINNNRPNDSHNTILTHILEYLDQISIHQRLFNESISKSDRCLEALVSAVSSISDTADGLTKKLEAQDEILGKLERNSRGDDKKPKEIDMIKVLVGEMKAFKKTLGKSCDGDDGRTVLGRLDAVTFAVGELLERARDPEANLPGPSAAPTIIDLTEASPPPMRHTSPVQSRTYADVGTSLVSSPLPLKEKSSALVQASTSPRSGFNSLQSSPAKSTPYPSRSSSGHSFVKDTATSPDTRSTTLTQDNLKLASPIPMDVDAADPTQSTIDFQISSTISMNNSDDVSRTQTNSQLSNRTAVHSSMPSDFTSAKVTQTSQNITGLGASTHKNDEPPNSQSASLTPGPVPGISTFILPHTTTSASLSTASTASTFGASLAIAPTSFTEVQHPADKTIAAVTASGVANLSVSEGKQQHNEKSQKQSPSTRDEETSLDNMNSEGLIAGADGKGYNEEIKAMEEDLDRVEGKEKIKRIENQVFELDENRKIDVPVSAPGPIDLSRHLRRRRSSPRFASPSTSLPSRARTGSRHSVPSEDLSYPSGLSSDTKLYSPTKTKVLVGVGARRSPGLVASTVSPSTASVTARTPTTPIKKPTSVASSRSASRRTTVNAEVVAPARPATPASILTNPAVSPKRRITPAVSESSHLESASASMPVMTNKPRPHSQTPTFPAAISSVPVPVVSPTKNFNPATAMFNDFPPSQASTDATQDEASVSEMVIGKENESNEGGGENLVDGKIGLKTASLKYAQREEERSDSEDLAEKTTRKIGLKTASPKFEKDEEEKQADRPPSSSSPSLFSSALSPSISGTPHRPVKVSGPSTPRPQSFALLPDSPLASASRSNQTQNNKTPELSGVFSLSPLPSVTCTPTTPSEVEASASTPMPTQNRVSIEMLLPLDLSPIPNVENGTRTVEGTEKMRMEKLYTSLGDDADIVRAKKRKVSEGSGMTDKSSKSLVAKEKEKAKKEEIDGLETKSGEPAKKQSLFSLKARRKGDSVAATRVKKRKARPDSIVDGEANGEGQHDDGLDEEKPLKRARQRVSGRQIKMEPLKKGKQLSREFSGSSFGTETSTRVMKPRSASVKKGPPSKGRLSVNGRQGAEVEWPTMTRGDKSEDLVGCDKCTAWYHYGCVGLTAGDKRLQGGNKFFCPPCEAGTAIKKLNKDTECWRPGCSEPSGFIVEKIIGRFKKFVGGQGLEFKYLLQWKGYDLSESSWEPEESMFDPPFMIEKFRIDALEEGIDIDKDKTGLILLRVAKASCVPPPT